MIINPKKTNYIQEGKDRDNRIKVTIIWNRKASSKQNPNKEGNRKHKHRNKINP
jgi:hypothetical protein